MKIYGKTMIYSVNTRLNNLGKRRVNPDTPRSAALPPPHRHNHTIEIVRFVTNKILPCLRFGMADLKTR